MVSIKNGCGEKEIFFLDVFFTDFQSSDHNSDIEKKRKIDWSYGPI